MASRALQETQVDRETVEVWAVRVKRVLLEIRETLDRKDIRDLRVKEGTLAPEENPGQKELRVLMA